MTRTLSLSRRLRSNRLSWPGEWQFAGLLALTTATTYAVVVTGAALSSVESGAASQSMVLALTHWLFTLVTGLALAATVAMAWLTDTQRATRGALTAGALLFLGQVAVGAAVAVTGTTLTGRLHLALAAALFVLVLFALGRTLDVAADTTTDPSSTSESATAEPDTQTAGDIQHGLLARARAYLSLTKPRLMWLLCLLALAGTALAATTGQWADGPTVVAMLTGGVLSIGASGTFNHVYERDRDQQMDRTSDRPVATDQISARNAVVFGLSLGVLSLVVMAIFVNALAALLTLSAIVYYSVIYTVVLKPNTTWNIAIGGGSGALPALIGWVAATGSIGLPGLVLAAVVVAWTPAHFYNLAIVYRADYARAGYPMLPVVAGVATARRRILWTFGATLLATAALAVLTPLGWLFAVGTAGAGAVFLALLVRQYRRQTPEATLQSFHASNAYLGIVLLTIVLEAVLTAV